MTITVYNLSFHYGTAYYWLFLPYVNQKFILLKLLPIDHCSLFNERVEVPFCLTVLLTEAFKVVIIFPSVFLWRLLLLLLSHFSRVRLWTPPTAAHQAPPSLGFSRPKTLEWVAIAFSNAWKWKVKVKLLSHVRLLATPWTGANQGPPSMGFFRQECWSGVPLPSPLFGCCCYCC